MRLRKCDLINETQHETIPGSVYHMNFQIQTIEPFIKNKLFYFRGPFRG